MRTDTQTVTIPASYERVFAFLAEPANLPRWAVGFARDIRRNGDGWIVATGHGEMPIRYETEPRYGIVDFHLMPAPGVDAVAHSRLVANGDGVEYVFTQFQTPGISDEMFQGQVAALKDELEVLRVLFRAQAACDSGR